MSHYRCENSACRKVGDDYKPEDIIWKKGYGNEIALCISCNHQLKKIFLGEAPEPKPITSGLWPIDNPLNGLVWPAGAIRANPIVKEYKATEIPSFSSNDGFDNDLDPGVDHFDAGGAAIAKAIDDDILETVVKAAKVMDDADVPTEGRMVADANGITDVPYGFTEWHDPGKILADKAEEIPDELEMRDEVDAAFLKLITVARSINAYYTETRLMELNRELLNLIYVNLEKGD